MTMKLTVIGCYGGFPAAGEATSGYLFDQMVFVCLSTAGAEFCQSFSNTLI